MLSGLVPAKISYRRYYIGFFPELQGGFETWECPNTQLKEVKKGKGDRRAWMSGTIAVLLKPEAVIGPYENS